jgi:hypothetical protein
MEINLTNNNHYIIYPLQNQQYINLCEIKTSKKFSGSGIIIFFLENNDMKIILGIDHNNKFQEFGGKIERNNLTTQNALFLNARKELQEESVNLFILDQETYNYIDIQDSNNTFYRCFFYCFYNLNFNRLNNDFQQNKMNIDTNNPAYNEIKDIYAYSLNDIKKNKLNLNFRERTKKIIDLFDSKIILAHKNKKNLNRIQYKMITYKL